MSRSRGPTKEARDIERAVIAAGGRVEHTTKGHLLVYGPNGGMATIPSKIDDDTRGWDNSRATVRRETGIDIRPPRGGRTRRQKAKRS